jgi:hypothetical protein
MKNKCYIKSSEIFITCKSCKEKGIKRTMGLTCKGVETVHHNCIKCGYKIRPKDIN